VAKIMSKQPVWPKTLQLVVFDFDGVMTDNRVSINSEGIEQVTCHRGDGLGIGMLRKAGIPAMVVSTEANKVVAVRCAKLSLECHHGVSDKGAFLADYLALRSIDPSSVIYVGNDVNDRECFELVGMAVIVADTHPDVVPMADLVLTNKGGYGAVREICDMIISRYGPAADQSAIPSK
jgi:N-acylneuraminate cytidylyltransferase